jgi:hypothetical protein
LFNIGRHAKKEAAKWALTSRPKAVHDPLQFPTFGVPALFCFRSSLEMTSR